MIESESAETLRSSFQLRFEVVKADIDCVRKLVESTGFFAPHEVDVAVELVIERLTKGAASGYEFVIAQIPETSPTNTNPIAGYVCFGQIPCTVGSYDIYWIVISPQFQRRGLGRWLMQVAEQQIVANRGRKLFIDTSGRSEYQSTRLFYSNCGYSVVAELSDFYELGDSKVIFSKDAPSTSLA